MNSEFHKGKVGWKEAGLDPYTFKYWALREFHLPWKSDFGAWRNIPPDLTVFQVRKPTWTLHLYTISIHFQNKSSARNFRSLPQVVS